MENDRREVFEYFMNCGLAVSLSTFANFDGIINTDYVVVHNAPPRIVKEVVGTMNMVSLTEQGLMIPLTKKKRCGA
jgi:hypothetical protein